MRSYVKLFNELKRCKPEAKINNAYINSRDQLIIKTDSENDYHYLSSDWDPKAFEHGVTKLINEPKFFIAIYDVKNSFDVNDPDNKKFMLDNYNVTNMLRITKKSTNTPTELIKAIINNKETFDHITGLKKIKIGHSYVKVAPWKFDLQPDQCYHCQKIGHLKATCPDINQMQTCVRCAKQHPLPCKITNSAEFKCVNCLQNHASCSKSCPKLMEEAKRKKTLLEQKMTKKSQQYTRVPSAQPVQTNKPIENQNNNQMLNLILFVIEIIKNFAKFQESIDNDPSEVGKLVTNFFGPSFAKTIENQLNQEITNNLMDEDLQDEY
jgi:hypothetical protein